MSYREPGERGGHGAAEPEAGPHGVRRPRLPNSLAPHGLGRQQLLLHIIFFPTSLKIINNENEKKCEIIKIHKDSFKNIVKPNRKKIPKNKYKKYF